MPRVDPEELGDRELACVFIAVTLAEARRAEELLTDRGVNYVIQPEPFGRTLLGSPRVGAAFYVPVGQAEYCGSQLVTAGFGLGVLISGPPER
jgi:hypothetical protein